MYSQERTDWKFLRKRTIFLLKREIWLALPIIQQHLAPIIFMTLLKKISPSTTLQENSGFLTDPHKCEMSVKGESMYKVTCGVGH